MGLSLPSARPFLRIESLEDRVVPTGSVFTVDDSYTTNTSTKFTTIQAAVNAAGPNHTIKVLSGTYTEEVTVGPTKSGVRLLAQGNNVTLTGPAGSGEPFAILTVDGASKVVVDGFKIKGPVAAADLGAGILVQGGGSATIRNNRISDIATSPLSGLQFGDGVVVGGFLADGTPTAGSAVVENNTIVRYQKTGVVVLNEGSSAVVRDNTIVGVGPTAVVAQNGVQVSDGAAATVAGNTISGNNYTPAGVESAGVYLVDAGTVTVTKNRVTGNEVGVLVEDQTAPAFIGTNVVTGNALDGIGVFRSAGVVIYANQVTGSGRDGVRLDGVTNSVVALNRVTASSEVGVRVTGASAGNFLALNRLTGNGLFDALDTTTGGGTAGTANLWLFNRIDESGTPGL